MITLAQTMRDLILVSNSEWEDADCEGVEAILGISYAEVSPRELQFSVLIDDEDASTIGVRYWRSLNQYDSSVILTCVDIYVLAETGSVTRKYQIKGDEFVHV